MIVIILVEKNESKGNRCSSGVASRRAAHAAFSRSLTDAHASTHFSHPYPSQTIPLTSSQPLSPSSFTRTQSWVHSCSTRYTLLSFFLIQCSFLSFFLSSRLLLLHICSLLPLLSAVLLSFFSFSSVVFLLDPPSHDNSRRLLVSFFWISVGVEISRATPRCFSSRIWADSRLRDDRYPLSFGIIGVFVLVVSRDLSDSWYFADFRAVVGTSCEWE